LRDGWGHAEPLREFQTETSEESGLSRVGTYHAAKPEFATVLRREHDVGALNATEFVQDGAGALPKAGPPLPLLEGLPQYVREEADEDVRLNPVGPLVPHGANRQLRRANRSCIARSFSRRSIERTSRNVS
jgi:hypothetical protein